MKKTGAKEAVFAVLLLITALLIGVLTVYTLNVKSMGYGNRMTLMAAQENANETSTYFELGNNHMIEIDGSNHFLAVMQYAPSQWPFRFACGNNYASGNSVNYPHQDGAYFFAQNGDTIRILNIETNEYIANGTAADLQERGLTLSDANLVTEKEVQETYPLLSVRKESCFTMTLAFVSLYIVLVPLYLFLLWKTKK